MTQTDLPAPLKRAWAAGVFEGKCAISDKTTALYFDSTNESMLQNFVDITGCGYIRKNPKAGSARIYTSYRWATKSLNDARDVALFVLPCLGNTKAAQATKLIRRIEGNPSWRKRNPAKKRVTY